MFPPGFSITDGVIDALKKTNVEGIMTRYMESKNTEVVGLKRLMADMVKRNNFI